MGFWAMIATCNFSANTAARNKILVSSVYKQLTNSRSALVCIYNQRSDSANATVYMKQFCNMKTDYSRNNSVFFGD